MAFEWLTGNSPQFWKNYLSLFENEETGKNKRFVVFDMEATGLDWKEDTIISIGAIALHNNALSVNDFFYINLNDGSAYKKSTSNEDLIITEGDSVVEAEAIIQFLNYIKDATLVGHNINLDSEMLNQALKRLELGRLKNQLMDTNVLYKRWKGLADDDVYSLDDICDNLKIEKTNRHSSWENAYTTALIFLKLKQKLGI